MSGATLRVRPRAAREYGAGLPCDVSVSAAGALQLSCADPDGAASLRALLLERLYVAGQGFRSLRRSPDGALLRAGERVEVARYVPLDAPADQLLRAIYDNLEICGEFELSWL